jgi:hypothetical protein
MAELMNEEVVRATSPDELIAQGYGLICRGLFRLDKQGDFKEAELELANLVDLFTQDHVQAMKKSRTVGGMPFPR